MYVFPYRLSSSGATAAVTTALPDETAVKVPLSTVTTDGSEDVHTIVFSALILLSLAFRTAVSPIPCRETETGETEMEGTSTASCTYTVYVPAVVYPLHPEPVSNVMTAVPAFSAVTTPADETFATDESDDFHFLLLYQELTSGCGIFRVSPTRSVYSALSL